MDLLHAAKVLGERISQGPTLSFLILMLAVIFGPRLVERLRLPAMVGLVLAGMAVGPHAGRLLDSDKIAPTAPAQRKIDYLTKPILRGELVPTDVLDTRVDMLDDLRSRVAAMKLDLELLMSHVSASH